jgi:arylsulfatase A-like enzyme
MAGSEPVWPQRPSAPPGAPNIVVVLVDDVGFADLGCQGSEIPTPNLDRLATEGVQFTNFHSAPMCSPTRAALLTGLNPHRAGVGHVAQDDPGFPGYRAELADDCVTMAETLRASGWATFCVGKWHLCRDADTSAAGPMHSWPVQRGFERFYGILDAFTNLHHPHQLVSDNSHLDVDTYPDGYHLTDDLTDMAIAMIAQRQAVRPDQPFLMYLAHPAAHAPLHARADDIALFAGVYDCGWDEIRARRHARQIELGIVAPGTPLPPRNDEPGDEVPAWDDLDADTQRLFAAYMATYAGMVHHLDRSMGQLRAALTDMGIWDDTIVVFMSDNGASREGEATGTTNYYNHLAAQVGAGTADVADDVARIDLIGGPRTMAHYPRGWAMASNTPFRLYKRNTHAGGHQVPCIMHVGANVAANADVSTVAGLRHQYAHVVDVWPTLADLAGVDLTRGTGGHAGASASAPDGIAAGLDGVSLVPVLGDPGHDEVRTEQLYELAGHRGLYRQGWEVVSRHMGPAGFDDTEWELYDLANDPTETNNLADDDAERVGQLSARWDELARAGQVYPLDEGSSWRWIARRDDDRVHDQPLTMWPGTPSLDHWRSSRLLWHRTCDVTIRLHHRTGDAGVLVAHGDQGGGYVVWVDDGRVHAAFNDGNGHLTELDGGGLPDGPVTIGLRIEAPGGWRTNLALSVAGDERARVDDLPMLFPLAPFEGISVGRDPRSPVHWDLHQRHGSFPFSGELHRVDYQPGAPAPDHPENFLEITRQIGSAYE